ncbi:MULTISPECIES: DUF305 domain-containing protein [unclassified Spirosoma]|uniref:DUF305 domain-containing protein n=1 Tax=unclassified Spirosoma TaxID=2621999 RepID=UPI00095C688F|nr:MULTISPECIES: DUF305 domain-containing protein [unclassified Spirosoma]MBN8823218.1 DUF305 domain-containing protein [Spirosoma sp.]OJW72633.1 MAG: DUF305 domain-containing protein [Spirosoma sp. 48-14]
MKTLQSNLVIWGLAFSLSGISFAACAQATTSAATSTHSASDPAKTALLTPLQQTVTKIKKLVATGDPDFDYAFQAKIHAQGAQDLLKQEIQNGKDTSLLKMAKTLLPATEADINLVDGTMRQLKPTRPSQAFTQQQSRNIEAMGLKLQQTGTSDKLTSNLDKNFATLLADQRQDAIDMATTYLQYGKNETLRTYAQQLIDRSKKEIEQIKGMQK